MPLNAKARAALEALLAEDTEGASSADTPTEGGTKPQPNADGDYPVRLVLAVEGHETSDRRLIAPGALSTRAFPQSIAAQTQPGHGGDPGPSIICGRLDAAERVPGPEVRSRETGEPFPEGTFVWRGTGVLFGEKGKPAQHGSPLDLVLKGGLTGNSVDLNSVEVELTFDAEGEGGASPAPLGSGLPGEPEPNEDGTTTVKPPRPPLQTFTKAKLGMTTLVPVPAFAEAYVELGTEDGWEVVTPASELADVEPSPFITAELPDDEPQGLVASAAGSDPLPPAWWFDEPKDKTSALEDTVPLQIEEPDPAVGGLRRVWGYVLSWKACHTGFVDRCVPPPRSPSGYAAYHVGTTVAMAEDGGPLRVATGPLTIGGGHASTAAGVTRAAAIRHYDDATTQAGRLRCGEDSLGVWAAGYLWPETSDADVRILRASPPSGDWRDEYRQPQDMIAVHCVNVPGFRHKTAYRADEHGVHALVAAGAVPARQVVASSAGYDHERLVADVISGLAEALGGTVAHVAPARPDTNAGEDRDALAQRQLAARRSALLQRDDVPDVEALEQAAGLLALAAYRDDLAGRALEALDDSDRDALGDLAPGLVDDDAPDSDAFKANWVTKAGGLPSMIKRVAKHLKAKGMEESHAIATAVNVVKKWCSNPDGLNFPGSQTPTGKTRAQGCKAVAEWEAKKAKARAS